MSETPDIRVILDRANVEEGAAFNAAVIQRIGATTPIQEWFHIPKRTNKEN